MYIDDFGWDVFGQELRSNSTLRSLALRRCVTPAGESRRTISTSRLLRCRNHRNPLNAG